MQTTPGSNRKADLEAATGDNTTMLKAIVKVKVLTSFET